MKINTTPGETYIVLSTGGCTVTTGAGKQIKKLAAGQDFFTAMTGDSILSDDNASVTVAKGEMLALLNLDGSGSDVQATLRFQPVTSQTALPATGENGVIYLVPNGADAPNQYTEWVWTGAAYEQLGDVGVDLSRYAKLNDANTFTTTQKFDAGLEAKGGISLQNTLTLGQATMSASGDTLELSYVQAMRIGSDYLMAPRGRITEITIVDCIYPSERLSIGSNIHILTPNASSILTELILGDDVNMYGFGYRHYSTADHGAYDILDVSSSGMIFLREGSKLRCGDSSSGISMTTSDYSGGTNMATLELGAQAQMVVAGDGIKLYTDASGVATLYVGDNARITGPGFSGSGSGEDISAQRVITDNLYVNTIHVNDTDEEIEIRAHVTNVYSLGVHGDIKATCFRVRNSDNISVDDIRLGRDRNPATGATSMTELYLGEGVYITGPGWDTMVQQIQAGSSGGTGSTGGGNEMDNLYVRSIFPKYTGDADSTISIYANVTGVMSLGVNDDLYVGKQITTYGGNIRIGKAPIDSEVDGLYLGPGMHIIGPGWEEMQAAAAATAAELEQPSFTKLIFPPTGTATAEQDPSWITKSHILMQTNGGQLNMTQLTATLAYAAQTPLAIAKRTLWLSTSPGTGDAVQWPANAVFPDDQPQDKIQQLNSNSTYWFDITYVGGSDTVLIRKVCSWASTTGESGPTE